MKIVGVVLAYIVGVFLVIRAVVELVTVDYSSEASYEHDWGGPTLVGVLLVHCLPGVIAAALMVWDIRRRRQRRMDGRPSG